MQQRQQQRQNKRWVYYGTADPLSPPLLEKHTGCSVFWVKRSPSSSTQTISRRGCPFLPPCQLQPTTSESSPPPDLLLMPLVPASSTPRHPTTLGLRRFLLGVHPEILLVLQLRSCFAPHLLLLGHVSSLGVLFRRPARFQLIVASRNACVASQSCVLVDALHSLKVTALRSYRGTHYGHRFISRFPVRAT